MTKIHHFDSTGAAYDACQCDENISTGDVLVIRSERVVGIADAWPIAVTAEHGVLHTLKPGVKIEDYCARNITAAAAGDALEVARAEIAKLDAPVAIVAEPTATEPTADAGADALLADLRSKCLTLAIDSAEINDRQRKTIERIRRLIVENKSCGRPQTHEFKTFEIKKFAGSGPMFLVTDYGMIGDEGTAASMICRDRRHFQIGKNGGVRLLSLDSNLRTSTPAYRSVAGVFNCINYYHPTEKVRA